mmetsp:Transcript_105604/g.193598  ORF Transcript_105604/g.193598 Transcript_105604/m.193598 type:complete len:126 (-) Transcript_105604:120-497(-)
MDAPLVGEQEEKPTSTCCGVAVIITSLVYFALGVIGFLPALMLVMASDSCGARSSLLCQYLVLWLLLAQATVFSFPAMGAIGLLILGLDCCKVCKPKPKVYVIGYLIPVCLAVLWIVVSFILGFH